MDREEFLAVMEGKELPPIVLSQDTPNAPDSTKDEDVKTSQSLKPPGWNPGQPKVK